VPPDLALRWRALLDACTIREGAAAPVRASLEAAYAEPHRTYHTLAHVAHVLAELDGAGVTDAAALWAAWLHDVVYVPGRPDNEALSAARAEAALASLGLERLAPRVAALVRATRDHVAAEDDAGALLLLDADLAILGAAPDAYRAYADGVAREHGGIPRFLYRRGRRRFLAAMLERPFIFRTAHFRERHERRARENLARELASLTSPASP
jgi:predicted metal-dependent HD superfamily phosphohydrolase